MKDDSAPPSGGVGSSRWKELIEVASPISGRELDPTLPPLVPRPTLPSNHTLPSGGGPCWTPPAVPMVVDRSVYKILQGGSVNSKVDLWIKN